MGKGNILVSLERIEELENFNSIAIPLLKDEWVELDDGLGTYRYHADIEGLKADSNPLILLSSVNAEATEEELKAYDLLQDKTIIEDGHIIFSAAARPEISFTVIVKDAVSGDGQAIADTTALVAKVNELETEIDTINSDILTDLFISKTITSTYELTSTEQGAILNVENLIPEGYTLMSVRGDTGYGNADVVKVGTINDNDIRFTYYTLRGINITLPITFSFVFAKAICFNSDM